MMSKSVCVLLALTAWPVAAERVKLANILRMEHQRLPLIPYPSTVLPGKGGTFVLKKGASLSVGPGIPHDDLAVTSVRKLVADAGEAGEGAGISMRLAKKPSDAAEGYTLNVDHTGVELEAPSLAGLFQGVQTLKQLAYPSKEPSAHLQAVAIHDVPRFGWRGLHLDVSRHFFNASSVKRLLDVMAQYKLNTFHWHLTDDQGWRLPVDGYPKLLTVGADGKAYTKEEIKDVVSYAKARHINVVPEVDVPGHVEAALAAYPELGNVDVKGRVAPKATRKEWGVSDYTLAPTNATWSFLEKVYDSLGELFPTQVVHIGGDEVIKTEWRSSQVAQGLLQTTEHAMSVEQKVATLFEEKINGMLKKRGRRVAAWNEALRTKGFPTDGIVVSWQDSSAVSEAISKGRQVVVADQSSLYFDHAQASKGEPNNFGGCTSLANVYGYDPMPKGLSAQQQKLVLGGQGQLWSEYLPTWEQAEYMAHPRSMALAERLWTPAEGSRSLEEFQSRLRLRLWDLERAGVNYRRLAKAGGCPSYR